MENVTCIHRYKLNSCLMCRQGLLWLCSLPPLGCANSMGFGVKSKFHHLLTLLNGTLMTDNLPKSSICAFKFVQLLPICKLLSIDNIPICTQITLQRGDGPIVLCSSHTVYCQTLGCLQIRNVEEAIPMEFSFAFSSI